MLGSPIEEAKAAMILLHGRDSTAEKISKLTKKLNLEQFAIFIPQASNNTWYPHCFTEPVEKNEPFLTSALNTVDEIVQHIKSNKICLDKLIFVGFSQGASLALEYVARNANETYGGVVGLSGGVIGERNSLREYKGDLKGTTAFIAGSDVDEWVPMWKLEQTAEVFEKLKAKVVYKVYENLGHKINKDEINFIQSLADSLVH